MRRAGSGRAPGPRASAARVKVALSSRRSASSARPTGAGAGRHGDLLMGLAHQVVRECACKGIEVAPQLALEALCLLQVNPENTRQGSVNVVGEALPPQERPLLAACIRFLQDRSAPGLAATRMRIAFRRKYKTPEDIAAEHARGTEARVAPLLAEVLEDAHDELPAAASPPAAAPPSPVTAKLAKVSKKALSARDERADKERLYASVVAAAVLRSGLGSPADPAVIKEANGTVQQRHVWLTPGSASLNFFFDPARFEM
ncbi:cilia- and flagella-associated protein 206-like [Frankliniella occidentalis]|uniref:Cilia- and flagella-associated protein 206-like n=1 Tax=Frankliniella occidentalis TaxID=133901 RepID=A0A9C6X1T2_FRAOC|nr:cilia- and flagella-associated protein 206-like [Frankliniella occidentalis]